MNAPRPRFARQVDARWLALIALLVVSLTACFDNSPGNPDPHPGGYFGVSDVTVHGRGVPCVTWKNGYAGGVSCDWRP